MRRSNTISSLLLKVALFILLAGILCPTGEVWAAKSVTITAAQNGNWNTPATWDLNRVPIASDKVVIATGFTVTIDVSTAAINYLEVQTGATLKGGSTAVTLNIDKTNGADIVVNGTGVFDANGVVTIALGAANSWSGAGTWNLYTLDLGGGNNTLTLTGFTDTLHLNAQTPITNLGKFTVGTTGIIDFNRAGKQTIAAGLNYPNVMISNKAAADTVTLESGTISIAKSFYPSTVAKYVTTGNTVAFNGTSAQGIPAFNYNNLTFSGAHGSSFDTLRSGTISVSGTLTSSATFNTNFGYINTGNTISFDASGSQTIPILAGSTGLNYGSIQSTGSGARTLSTTAVGGNAYIGIAGTFSPGTNTYTTTGSTVNYNFAGSQTIAAFNKYNNLTISGARASGTVTLGSGTIYIGGTFTTSATSVTYAASTTDTVNFNGTGAQTVQPIQYNVLQITGARTTNSVTLSASGTISVAKTFSPTATFTSGNYIFTSSTISYNGSSNQFVALFRRYNNLTLAGSGTKTQDGAIVVNGNLTISSGSTFSDSTFNDSLGGNWSNSGSFDSTRGVTTFWGVNKTITGATTFKTLFLNSATTTDTVKSNIRVDSLHLNAGALYTGTNTITLTRARSSGTGTISGIVKWQPLTGSLTAGTAYAFEGPNNLVTFTGARTVVSITDTITLGAISDFSGSVNRQYKFGFTSSGSGTFTTTLRLHYLTSELNGNTDTSLHLWKYSTSGATWGDSGRTGNVNTTSNYVERTTLDTTAFKGRWALSGPQVYNTWIGAAPGGNGTDWYDTRNWNQGHSPAVNEIVRLGVGTYTNLPTISATSATVRAINFSGGTATTLTLNGANLTVSGNITDTTGANQSHTIAVGANTLTISGSAILSDGTANHRINLTASTGTISVASDLNQLGNANITFSGSGNMFVGGDYNYTSGTFTPASGTVTYNGASAQSVAGVYYNNLVINGGSTQTATLSGTAQIRTLLLDSTGTFTVNGTITDTGSVRISSAATLDGGSGNIYVGGTWLNNGTFTASTGTVIFNGTSSAQTISATDFNNLTIASSVVDSLTGSINVGNVLSINSGTLAMGSRAIDSLSTGDSLIIARSGTLRTQATFPTNFATYYLKGIVDYNGTGAQTVSAQNYGSLTISNASRSGAVTFETTSNIGIDSLFNFPLTFTNYVYAGSTIEFNGSILDTIPAFHYYYNLFSSGSGARRFAASDTIRVYNSFDPGANTFTTVSTSLMNYAGTTGQQIAKFSNYGSVQVSGTGTKSLQDSINIAGNLVVSTGSLDLGLYAANHTSPAGGSLILATSSDSLYVGGNTGGVTGSNFPANYTTYTLTGWVNYTASDFQTIADSSGSVNLQYTNLTLTNVGTKTLAAGQTNVSGIFSIPGSAYVDGTANTSTFNYNGAGAQTIIGIDYTNLKITNTPRAITFQADTVGIAGTFSPGGPASNFTVTDGNMFDYNGTGAQTVTDTIKYYNLLISNTGTRTLNGIDSVKNSLQVTGGTLDLSSFTLNKVSTSSASLTLGGGATLKIGGTNGFPTYSTYSIANTGTLSTVEYSGTLQTISNPGTPYGHLKFSGGKKTINVGTTVTAYGNFTPDSQFLNNGSIIVGQ